MKRQIVIFVPNKKFYLEEFNILYHNFKNLGLEKDTEILLFCSAAALKQLTFLYKPFVNGAKVQLTEESFFPEVRYEFINSIAIFTHPIFTYSHLYSYAEYMLKTDTDVFLTPKFIDWYPNGKFITGQGAYCHEQGVKDMIYEVSKRLGLNHRGIHNIGATWYGSTKDIIEVGKLSTQVTKFILDEYFQDRKFSWPNWTYGVASMYGSEIAINHLVADKLVIDEQNLDYFSDSDKSINSTAHIHCRHTDKKYSKFWFRDGKYDGINPESLNADVISDYCLKTALNSK